MRTSFLTSIFTTWAAISFALPDPQTIRGTSGPNGQALGNNAGTRTDNSVGGVANNAGGASTAAGEAADNNAVGVLSANNAGSSRSTTADITGD